MNTTQHRNAPEQVDATAAAHEPESVKDRDNQEKPAEIDPGITEKTTQGIDPPPARKPASTLVTPAVECVVEWHRQRADARSRAL